MSVHIFFVFYLMLQPKKFAFMFGIYSFGRYGQMGKMALNMIPYICLTVIEYNTLYRSVGLPLATKPYTGLLVCHLIQHHI